MASLRQHPKINGPNEKANISYDYETSIKEIDLLFKLATKAKEVILHNMSKVGTRKKALDVLKCFSNHLAQLTSIRNGLMNFRSAKTKTNSLNTAFTNIFSNAEMVKMSTIDNLKSLEKQTGISLFGFSMLQAVSDSDSDSDDE